MLSHGSSPCEALLDEALEETFPASDPIAPMGGSPTTHSEAQTAMHKSQLDIAERVRHASIALLQARLATAIDLEAQLKQAHWNVKGREFFQLHQLFDEIHAEVEDFVDTLAERITALQGIADGRLQSAARTTTLDVYPTDAVSGEDHLRAVGRALAQFGTAVRADIDASAVGGDAGTADVFTEISRATDKQLWLVEAHLYDS
jgi:starvation-inducible DNA-binding protein